MQACNHPYLFLETGSPVPLPAGPAGGRLPLRAPPSVRPAARPAMGTPSAVMSEPSPQKAVKSAQGPTLAAADESDAAGQSATVDAKRQAGQPGSSATPAEAPDQARVSPTATAGHSRSIAEQQPQSADCSVDPNGGSMSKPEGRLRASGAATNFQSDQHPVDASRLGIPAPATESATAVDAGVCERWPGSASDAAPAVSPSQQQQQQPPPASGAASSALTTLRPLSQQTHEQQQLVRAAGKLAFLAHALPKLRAAGVLLCTSHHGRLGIVMRSPSLPHTHPNTYTCTGSMQSGRHAERSPVWSCKFAQPHRPSVMKPPNNLLGHANVLPIP